MCLGLGWSLVWRLGCGLGLGTCLVCPGWCLLGHGISQSFHTKVSEEFVVEASRAAAAHEISASSVRKFQKGSFWELREGMRPRDFLTSPSERVARIRF